EQVIRDDELWRSSHRLSEWRFADPAAADVAVTLDGQARPAADHRSGGKWQHASTPRFFALVLDRADAGRLRLRLWRPRNRHRAARMTAPQSMTKRKGEIRNRPSRDAVGTAIWSFWSEPFRQQRSYWKSDRHHLLSWVLSLETARKHFHRTVLY